jgi:hypothetical protein
MKGVKVRNLRLALLVVLGLTMWAKASDAPSSETIWQIGRFDTSSAEFASGATPNPAPVYVIGVSQPDKDWYAFQPGSANGSAGHKPNPVRVEFNLPAPPVGLYAMKIRLLVEHPRVSALQVDIGGQTARAEVTIPVLDVQSAWQSNAVEANQKELPLTGNHGFAFESKPHQIVTVRVKGTLALPTPVG